MPSQQGGSTIINIATDDQVIGYMLGTAGAASGTRMLRIGGTDGTLDRVAYMDTLGRIYTVRNWTIAGEDAGNNRTDIQVKYRDSATDASAALTVNGTTEGTATTMVDWTDVSHYTAFEIYIGNGATALTNVYVYTAPTAADTYRVNLASYKDTLELACQTLGANASGLAFRGTAGHGLKYIKVTGTVAAGSSTCYSWLEKNV